MSQHQQRGRTARPQRSGGVPRAFYAVALLALSVESIAGLRVSALLLTLTSLGLLFSLYLSYLQLFEIKAICFWCALSALIELAIWVAALLDWRQAQRG